MSPPEILQALTPVVEALEQLVLAKLEWFRAGGEVSERQWGDVVGVLKTQGPTLDRGSSGNGRRLSA